MEGEVECEFFMKIGIRLGSGTSDRRMALKLGIKRGNV